MDSATSITSGITAEVPRNRQEERTAFPSASAHSLQSLLIFSTRLRGGLDSATSVTSGFGVEVLRNPLDRLVEESAKLV